MSTSGFPDKRVWGLAALSVSVLGLSGCDFFAKDERAAGEPVAAASASPVTPANGPPAAPAEVGLAGDATDPLALDLDGDGKADSVRIARVGHYVVDDPLTVKAGNAATLPDIDWNQDAVVVKLASGGEKAVNFPNVRSIAAMRSGSPAEKRARGLGCDIPPAGQALLAEAEEGAMVIHRTSEGLVAEACAE